MSLPQRTPEEGAPHLAFPAPTAGAIVEWYLAQPGALGTSEESRRERRRILELFAAAYGHESCDAGRPYMLDDFIAAQPGLRAQNTRKRWYGTILAAFNYAAKRRKIDRNPFVGPQIPLGDEGRDLTPAEFRSVYRLACPAYRRVLVFLRETGCRPGEMRAVTIGQLDLPNRRIIQQKHKTRAKTREPRLILLSRRAVRLVKRLIARAGPAGHLFLNSEGRPWSTQALTKNFRTLRRKAGLAEDARQYGNRHALATQLLGEGESPAIVAEILGHKGTQTLRRYTHLRGKPYLLDAIDRKGKAK